MVSFKRGGARLKDFAGPGDGNRVAQDGEDQGGVDGDSRDEHVVRPDEESEDGDRDRREGDEAVSEDALAREAGDDFSDYAHRGQDHDIDGGMRVKPEQVLEQKRITAKLRIEDAEM